MLAKPEYFSPPDEVCCWPGRCGGAVAGRGAVLRCCVQGSVAEMLLAEALWRRTIGNHLLAGTPWRSCIGKPTSAHKKRRARKRPKYLSRAASIYCLAKGQHAMRRGRTAVHRRHAVQAKLPPAFSDGEVAAAIMQGLQGRLQQMQELRRALGIRQG